jgi:hypothetical protein
VQKRTQGDVVNALESLMEWVCNRDQKLFAKGAPGNPGVVLSTILAQVNKR